MIMKLFILISIFAASITSCTSNAIISLNNGDTVKVNGIPQTTNVTLISANYGDNWTICDYHMPDTIMTVQLNNQTRTIIYTNGTLIK